MQEDAEVRLAGALRHLSGTLQRGAAGAEDGEAAAQDVQAALKDYLQAEGVTGVSCARCSASRGG